MILDEISRLRAYASLHPGFLQLADYLEQHDLTQAPTGRIEIDGEQLFINVDETTMKTREEQLLEVHRRYIDVHFPLSGTEICGWSPLSSLTTPRVPYDAQLDRAFYPGPAQTYFDIQPGQCYIVSRRRPRPHHRPRHDEETRGESAHQPLKFSDGSVRRHIPRDNLFTMQYDFYKENDTDRIWWVDTVDRIGLYLFSFDRKKIYNLFSDYPHKLSAEEKRIFDEENPYWKAFFRA